MQIQSGFLTGNFEPNLSAEQAKTLAGHLENALRKSFPTADVEINWQHGQGSIPYNCRFLVDGSADAPEIDAVREITERVTAEFTESVA
jgi:hypothetical protein